MTLRCQSLLNFREATRARVALTRAIPQINRPLICCTPVRHGRAGRWTFVFVITTACPLIFSAPVEAQAPCTFAPGEIVVARDAPYTRRLAEMEHQLEIGPSTIVFGDSVAGRWPLSILEPLFTKDILVLAHGGDGIENTSWMVDQFNQRAAAGVRNIVVAVGSANARSDSSCAWKMKAEALFRRLRDRFPKAKIYYINVVQKGPEAWPIEQRVLEENRVLDAAARAASIVYVDAHTPLVERCHSERDCRLFSADHVHPSVEGFQIMTDALRSAAAPR